MWKFSSSCLTKGPVLRFNKATVSGIVKNLIPVRTNWLQTYLIKTEIKKFNNPQLICSKVRFGKSLSNQFLSKNQKININNFSKHTWFNFIRRGAIQNFELSTIRNSSLHFPIMNEFAKIIFFADLPFFFDKGLYNIVRYAASFYGISPNDNSENIGLWLTMGLKRNIAVPFGLFFKTNKPRRNYLLKINKKSWHKYIYLVKNSFIKGYSLSISLCENFYISERDQYFFLYTDFCHYLRRVRFKYHRAIPIINDIDYSVSTYHAKFEYFDLRQRAVFCWIANNNLLRDSAFFIRSSDTSLILYPQRYFKYKAFSEGLANFHKSWFFLDKISFLNRDLKIQKNLIDIVLELSIKQIWANSDFFMQSSNQFLNFRLLVFYIIKKHTFSNVLLFLNKLLVKEISVYAFFLTLNSNLILKNKFKKLSVKIDLFNKFYMRSFPWYKRKLNGFLAKKVSVYYKKFFTFLLRTKQNRYKWNLSKKLLFQSLGFCKAKVFHFDRFKFINRYII